MRRSKGIVMRTEQYRAILNLATHMPNHYLCIRTWTLFFIQCHIKVVQQNTFLDILTP